MDELFREARALTSRGDLDGAARVHRRSVAAIEAVSPEHRALAEPLNELALWHAARGEAAEADALLARAQQLLEKAPGAREGPDQALPLARVLASRAQVCESLGRDADARQLNERALALFRAHDGEGPAVWIAAAGVLHALAGLAHRKRRFREAEPLFLQAIEQLERAVGPDDPRLLPLMDHLQSLYRSQGRVEAASALGRRAEGIRRGSPQRPG